MSNINEARQFRTAVSQICKDIISEQTRSCLRIYKAIVISAPNETTCSVRIIGDTITLDLPYSSKVANVTAGKAVWIAVPYNNLSAGIVWETIDFKDP